MPSVSESEFLLPNGMQPVWDATFRERSASKRPHGPSTVDEAKVEIALSEDVMPLKETDVTVSADHGTIVSMVRGDWTCSKCNNSNFAFRRVCNRCESARSRNQAQSRDVTPKLEAFGSWCEDRRPARTHGTRPSNDGRWMCQCGKSNDGRSRTCKKCGSPKAGKVATGADTVMTMSHEAVADGR